MTTTLAPETETTVLTPPTTIPPPVEAPVTKPPPQLRSLSGVLTLYQDKFTDKGCYGYDGYSDIGPGATVTIRDASDSVIATTRLSDCRFIETHSTTFPGMEGIPADPSTGWEGIPATPEMTMESGFMAFGFSAANVPDAEFYSIEISHRGKIVFSKGDLAAAGWKASLTLGP